MVGGRWKWRDRCTLSPALTLRVVPTALLLTLQVMSEEVTSTRGELLGGERMAVPVPWSASLIQTAWTVA